MKYLYEVHSFFSFSGHRSSARLSETNTHHLSFRAQRASRLENWKRLMDGKMGKKRRNNINKSESRWWNLYPNDDLALHNWSWEINKFFDWWFSFSSDTFLLLPGFIRLSCSWLHLFSSLPHMIPSCQGRCRIIHFSFRNLCSWMGKTS